VVKVDAYIALGGNQGDVADNLDRALRFLAQPPIISITARAPVYRTAAVGGPAGQPDFLNTVVRVSTALTPDLLLRRCLDVEQKLGRVRHERWGPRTIDLDLLLYGDHVVDVPGLTVPHPRIRERLFVLVPLADIAPSELSLPPDGMALGDVLDLALEREGATLGDYKSRIYI
jgi:2-amino-4-hydroxy-6-hydroxymethyldihydropteridine diphosphokinase